MLDFLERAVDKAAKLFLNISTLVAYPILIIVVLTDISLRTFFNNPLPWGNELSCLILIICFFGPSCICEREKSNIALDFLYTNFSRCGKLVVDLLGSICGTVWIGLLCYRNFVEIPDMIEYGETGVEFQYPLWPIRLFLAFALLLLLIQLVLNILSTTAKIARSK